MTTASSGIRILRLPDVEAKTGLRKTRIQLLEHRGEFPRRIKLTEHGRAAGWIESEVDQYLAVRIAASRGASGGSSVASGAGSQSPAHAEVAAR